jgi:hypothetical protein
MPKGQHKKTESIKWSKESINTSPQSIELNRGEDDNGSIILTQEGIYQISFILFMSEQSNPKISLHIDDQQVLTSIDASSNVVFHQDSQRQSTFTCFINADKLRQKLNICLTSSKSLVKSHSNATTARSNSSNQ